MSDAGATATSDVRERLLVLRCQAGDEDAFLALHDRNEASVRRYVISLLGPDLADDVVQDVWWTVFRKIRGLTNPAGFRTWVFRIARHLAIDVLRSEKRRSGLADRASSEVDDELLRRVEGGEAARALVREAMATLSPAHREAIRLRFLEDLTYGEIASITGQPIGTVRSRIHHARVRLRDALERLEPELGRN